MRPDTHVLIETLGWSGRLHRTIARVDELRPEPARSFLSWRLCPVPGAVPAQVPGLKVARSRRRRFWIDVRGEAPTPEAAVHLRTMDQIIRHWRPAGRVLTGTQRV
jgi:hypothetical protein